MIYLRVSIHSIHLLYQKVQTFLLRNIIVCQKNLLICFSDRLDCGSTSCRNDNRSEACPVMLLYGVTPAKAGVQWINAKNLFDKAISFYHKFDLTVHNMK